MTPYYTWFYRTYYRVQGSSNFFLYSVQPLLLVREVRYIFLKFCDATLLELCPTQNLKPENTVMYGNGHFPGFARTHWRLAYFLCGIGIFLRCWHGNPDYNTPSIPVYFLIIKINYRALKFKFCSQLLQTMTNEPWGL